MSLLAPWFYLFFPRSFVYMDRKQRKAARHVERARRRHALERALVDEAVRHMLKVRVCVCVCVCVGAFR